MKKTVILLLCIFLVLLTACDKVSTLTSFEELADKRKEARLSVHFVDVGQGDCTLLESGGEFVLIDGGESDYADTVLDYLDYCGVATLKYVIATHPHSDHYGSLRQVITNVKTESFITVETDCSTSPWLRLLDTVESEGVSYIDATVGTTYTFGEAEFTVLAPNSTGYDGYNNYSVVTKVTCDDISFILAGDAEKESEFEMLSADLDLSADVLKLGHHGSSTSSSVAFLMAVNPAFAVISCGADNSYGHPHTETVDKLSELGCTYFRTDTYGTVVAQTDGKTLTFTDKSGEAYPYAYTAGDAKNPNSELCYIANKRSGYFHESCCSGAQSMNEKNKVYIYSRDEALSSGYEPCPSCNP